jgi:hypothetical protein
MFDFPLGHMMKLEAVLGYVVQYSLLKRDFDASGQIDQELVEQNRK